jgi:hypothetical protein
MTEKEKKAKPWYRKDRYRYSIGIASLLLFGLAPITIIIWLIFVAIEILCD